MFELPPFNPRAVCPKCTYKDVQYHYLSAEPPTPHDAPGIPERLKRVCMRCEFTWYEQTADKAKEV